MGAIPAETKLIFKCFLIADTVLTLINRQVKTNGISTVSLDQHLQMNLHATLPLIALFQTIKPFICFPNLAAPPTVTEEGDEELN